MALMVLLQSLVCKVYSGYNNTHIKYSRIGRWFWPRSLVWFGWKLCFKVQNHCTWLQALDWLWSALLVCSGICGAVSVATWGKFFIWQVHEAQTQAKFHNYICRVVSFPLAKASHMAKPRVHVPGRFIPSQSKGKEVEHYLNSTPKADCKWIN